MGYINQAYQFFTNFVSRTLILVTVTPENYPVSGIIPL